MKHLLTLFALVALASAAGIEYWSRFEGNAKDMSGYGRDATVFGSAVYDTASGSECLYFDGTGDYVRLPAFYYDTSCSVVMFSAWIRSDTFTEQQRIMCEYGLEPVASIYRGGGGGDRLSVIPAGNACHDFEFFHGINDTRIHLTVFMHFNLWGGSYVFKNGVLDTTMTFVTASCPFPDSSGYRFLGIYDKDGNQFLTNAWLDDVVIATYPSLPSVAAMTAAAQRLMVGQRPIIPTPRNIDCIGNSITSGTAGHNNGYPTYLQNLFNPSSNVMVRNYGLGSDTTPYMRARFADMDWPAYAVVIMAGINDIRWNYADISLDSIEKNLQAMYDSASAWGAMVVAVTITPFKGDAYGQWDAPRQARTDSLNTWILAVPSNVDYAVNVYDSLESSPGSDSLPAAYDLGDRLHPNAAGAAKIARIIYNQCFK